MKKSRFTEEQATLVDRELAQLKSLWSQHDAAQQPVAVDGPLRSPPLNRGVHVHLSTATDHVADCPSLRKMK